MSGASSGGVPLAQGSIDTLAASSFHTESGGVGMVPGMPLVRLERETLGPASVALPGLERQSAWWSGFGVEDRWRARSDGWNRPLALSFGPPATDIEGEIGMISNSLFRITCNETQT